MPRYFLHVKDGSGLTHDPEGEELGDLAAAQQEAAAAARDLMAECLRKGEPLGVHREVVIDDQSGDMVATVSFASALPAEHEPPG